MANLPDAELPAARKEWTAYTRLIGIILHVPFTRKEAAVAE